VERFDVLGHAEMRAVLSYTRACALPVTAAETASALGIPRTAARWRLERLAAAGLLVPGFERRSGRTGPGAGRPAKTYSVAPETTPIEFPPRRYEQLMQLLIDALPRRRRPARLAEIGVEFGRQLAQAARLRPTSSPSVAVRRICEALGRLGFQASVASSSSAQAVIVTPTCPLRPLVATDAEARSLDQGMWRGLVAEALTGYGDAAVSCETHHCRDGLSACRVHITLGAGSSAHPASRASS
jgi:predicted ArsR family transcriptional regulator